MRRTALWLACLATSTSGVFGSACGSSASDRVVPIAARARSLDARTVEVTFTERLEPSSVSAAAMHIRSAFARPTETLAVESAEVEGSVLRLKTGPQNGGVLYALTLGPIHFADIAREDAPRQVNFVGYGLANVRVELDTNGYVAPASLTAEVTFAPETGEYSDALREVPLALSERAGVYAATVSLRIDPEATFGARAVTPEGGEAGRLTQFTVTSTRSLVVALAPLLPRVPEFLPPEDPTPGDGFAPVRVVLDDRAAGELAQPELRSSMDAEGRFDASINRLDRFRRVPGKGRVYEIILEVAVDPARSLEGTTAETFPYVAFLVEQGEDAPQRGANFAMPTETPQVVVIQNGNPALVPVKFRVDTKDAILEPDGRLRGKYPGEGIFLTGEFPSAEDALGRLAADAFTGGERATLEMRERPDAPGIYEKTIFMMPNRPYGWKVVRCPTGEGCAALNRRVISSGRAFPTVMKNLVTANIDAAQSRSVRLVDPAHLDQVELEGGSRADYSRAVVSESGDETPGPSVLFKQECPDLVVTVGTTPVTTPIYVVGTWRDVNIPQTPAELIGSSTTLDLSAFDYDDGFVGRYPPAREVMLPDDPAGGEEPSEPEGPVGVPAFVPEDGRPDASARRVLGDAGRLPLLLGWNGRELYFATDRASPGRDHFLLVSFDPPSSMQPVFWAKHGSGAFAARQVFLAMEGDGAFVGWFRRGGANGDGLLMSAGVRGGSGMVMEGTVDPVMLGLGRPGNSVWVAALAFETSDGGALLPTLQSPAGDGDVDLDPNEMLEVSLSELRAE